MNFLQWNTGRTLAKTGVNDISNYLQSQSISIALFQEVSDSLKLPCPGSYYCSKKSGIWVHNNVLSAPFPKLTIDCDEFSSVASLVSFPPQSSQLLVVSVYRNQLPYSEEGQAKLFFVEWLKNIVLSYPQYDIIIGGDFNIHATFLGSVNTDVGGSALESFADSIQGFGCFLNDGSATRVGWPGCSSPVTPSAIDATLFIGAMCNVTFQIFFHGLENL